MKKRLYQIISLFLIFILPLTACGGKGAKDTDKLVVATSSDATTLDPSAQNDSFASNVMCQIYNGLVEIDSEGNISEALAESYEIDGDTYIFKLKKGVKFHDGNEMTSEDVKFSFQRALASPAVAHIFAAIDANSLETPDEYTFQFKLKQSYAGIIAALCHPSAFIVSKEAVESDPDKFATDPVGTGPFKFVSWTKSHNVVLERFDDYHGDKPEFSSLEFKIIPEGNSRLIELETGGVDIAMDITPSDVKKVEENEELELYKIKDYGTTFMGINTEKEPFNNPKVREAISYGVDLEAVANAVWKGTGVTATAPYTSTLKYSIAEDNEPRKRDVDKAKKLLEEAGFKDGFTCSITTNERQERIDAATIIKEQLREIGIDITIEVLEWSAFIESLENGRQDMYIMAWISDSPDPDMVVYPCFHSSMAGPGGNYSFLKDDKCDELIEKGRETLDDKEREKMYVELQERIMDLVPTIFLHNSEILIGARENISNIEFTPFGYHRFYKVKQASQE